MKLTCTSFWMFFILCNLILNARKPISTLCRIWLTLDKEWRYPSLSIQKHKECRYYEAEPNIFLRICTHIHTITISNDLCSPMPTHSMTCAHPCPPMLFKLRPCIQKLCNVHYPPTPSLGWIGQIKGLSLSLALARSASWLACSLHPRSLTPIRTHAHPCPPMPTHEQ
jgi:hypothetical protein